MIKPNSFRSWVIVFQHRSIKRILPTIERCSFLNTIVRNLLRKIYQSISSYLPVSFDPWLIESYGGVSRNL